MTISFSWFTLYTECLSGFKFMFLSLTHQYNGFWRWVWRNQRVSPYKSSYAFEEEKPLFLPSSFPLSSPLPILPLHLQAPNKAPENHTVKTGTHKQRGGASPELNQMGILAASNSWNQKSEEILF